MGVPNSTKIPATTYMQIMGVPDPFGYGCQIPPLGSANSTADWGRVKDQSKRWFAPQGAANAIFNFPR
jgi:hypothetical protein